MIDRSLDSASTARAGEPAAVPAGEPGPEATTGDEVAAGQARVLLGSIPVGVVGGIVSSIVIAWILLDQLPPRHVVAWLIAAILMYALRLGMWFVARAEADPLSSARRWLVWLRVSMFGIGLSWAALPVFLFPPDPFFQMFLATVIAAAGGAGAAQQASDAPSALLFMLPSVLALAVRLLLSSNPTLEATGYLALVFSAYLAVVTRRIHAAFLEVSRLHAHEARQARIDPLTGLPNRSALGAGLRRALARAKRNATVVAVGYIDLDDFKRVNDANGHAAGDALLREVARRWRNELRETETIARLGGDEFVLVIEDIDPGDAAADIAAVCERMHCAVAMPFDVSPQESVRIGMTMGVACFPDDGIDPEVLLRRADAAMYRTKQGKDRRSRWWRFVTDAATETTG